MEPPPGVGLTTVMEAVAAAAMSDAGTVAVSCWPLTKAVLSAVPSKFTVAPETKPAPLTVRVNAPPPGAAEDGTKGWSTKGTGLPAAAEELIVMVRSPDCIERPSVSVSCNMKVTVPALVGVPLITPVLVPKLKPAGSEPEDSDQMKGPVPPDSVKG